MDPPCPTFQTFVLGLSSKFDSSVRRLTTTSAMEDTGQPQIQMPLIARSERYHADHNQDALHNEDDDRPPDALRNLPRRREDPSAASGTA